MKKLPIGIQTFSELIQHNYVYVDKTALIYTLITTGKNYFLSRPRRFGKSLLISTLENIFLGKKELFTDLAISTLPYDWAQHPVITISFSDIACTTPEILENTIKFYIQNIAHDYQVDINPNLNSGMMLHILVKTLAEQNSVALLIDEYDYSILQHLHKPTEAQAIREILKSFYAVFKGLDRYLTCLFVTGVSKFAQTSLFSGFNNLEDLSLTPEYNTLLGYTETEIEHSFKPHLVAAANTLEYSVTQLIPAIRSWYDGYQFTKDPKAQKMYNPFSVLLFLKHHDFSNYWFRTGTPTFLINVLKSQNYPVQEFDHVEATERDLDTFDIDNIPLKTVLFQTGYLTIEKYNKDTTNFTLTYPNKEVIKSFAGHIIVAMTNNDNANTSFNTMVAELRNRI